MKEVTFDDLWEDLKQEDSEIKEKLEIAEKLSSIIEQLVCTREKNGLTQKQLAESCGMQQSAIARIEKLQVIPRMDTLIKIAKSLDIEP